MVVPGPNAKPRPILGDDDQVIAYVVSAEQLKRMQDEVASLREQLETAIRQRDCHRAKEEELLKTLHVLPPTEEEMADPSLWTTSEDIRQVISDLESR